MSTTSNGAFSPVERRMMPSGSVASGESAGGVVHPFTQVAEGAPCVCGALWGSAGWVGVGSVDAVVVADVAEVEVVDAGVVEAGVVDAGVVEPADVAPVEASQDATASAAEIASGSRKCLCIG
jgi:hypothetical protein